MRQSTAIQVEITLKVSFPILRIHTPDPQETFVAVVGVRQVTDLSGHSRRGLTAIRPFTKRSISSLRSGRETVDVLCVDHFLPQS